MHFYLCIMQFWNNTEKKFQDKMIIFRIFQFFSNSEYFGICGKHQAIEGSIKIILIVYPK